MCVCTCACVRVFVCVYTYTGFLPEGKLSKSSSHQKHIWIRCHPQNIL